MVTLINTKCEKCGRNSVFSKLHSVKFNPSNKSSSGRPSMMIDNDVLKKLVIKIYGIARINRLIKY